MADQKRPNNDRKPRPKYNPSNKEQASRPNNKNKKRWHKHHKKPVDMATKLKQLQAYINDEFHMS
jgi:hypothetical protein